MTHSPRTDRAWTDDPAADPELTTVTAGRPGADDPERTRVRPPMPGRPAPPTGSDGADETHIDADSDEVKKAVEAHKAKRSQADRHGRQRPAPPPRLPWNGPGPGAPPHPQPLATPPRPPHAPPPGTPPPAGSAAQPYPRAPRRRPLAPPPDGGRPPTLPPRGRGPGPVSRSWSGERPPQAPSDRSSASETGAEVLDGELDSVTFDDEDLDDLEDEGDEDIDDAGDDDIGRRWETPPTDSGARAGRSSLLPALRRRGIPAATDPDEDEDSEHGQARRGGTERESRRRAREDERDQRARDRQLRHLERQQAKSSSRALPAGPGRAPKWGRRDPEEPKPSPARIATKTIDGNITRTDTTVTAWYRLSPKRWSFRPDEARNQLIRRIAAQLGGLRGRWLHLRVTSRPYPVGQWGWGFDDNSFDRPSDVAGALSWEDFLVAEQEVLQAQGMSEKEVFIGVEISRRDALSKWLTNLGPALSKFVPAQAGSSELEVLDAEILDIDSQMAEAGLDAVPARPEEMAWLMRRSVALGLPAPSWAASVTDGRWERDDLPALTDNAEMYAEPYDPCVQVEGLVDGERCKRWVAVLTVGDMNSIEIPESLPPWMTIAEHARVPVEWSVRMRVRPDDEVTNELRMQMSKVRSQVNHYQGEHDQDPPQQLAAQAEMARDVENELTHTGLRAENARVESWWRIAVSGETEDEALKNAKTLRAIYKPHINIEHPAGQYQLAREFIPGERLADRGYRRRGPTLWVGSAVPAATATIGDRHGLILGSTEDAARRPVMWDPWQAQEARGGIGQSGVTAVVGGLGSGKSFLTGLLVYKSLRAGARWTVLDPSGPLAALTKLPEVAPYARHVQLADADPGILNPYRVVADPRREDFSDEGDPENAYGRELRKAAATRRTLANDTLIGLLPYEIGRQTETTTVLNDAVRAVGGGMDRELGDVIDALQQRAATNSRREDPLAHHAGGVAQFLEERREQPEAALLFPDPNSTVTVDPWEDSADIRLTVLTLQSLTLPHPETPRENWSPAEALNVQLLNLASWLTQRAIYQTDPDQRKGVAMDEMHFLARASSGRALIDKLARDSRKHNVRVLFASQLARDLMKIPGFATLNNATFVGRTLDHEAQADALNLLGAPLGVGHEQQLGELSERHESRENEDEEPPREFVFADGYGGIERITVDMSGPHLAHLRDALDTNPNARRDHTPDGAQMPTARSRETPWRASRAAAVVSATSAADTTATGPVEPVRADDELEDTLEYGATPEAAAPEPSADHVTDPDQTDTSIPPIERVDEATVELGGPAGPGRPHEVDPSSEDDPEATAEYARDSWRRPAVGVRPGPGAAAAAAPGPGSLDAELDELLDQDLESGQ